MAMSMDTDILIFTEIVSPDAVGNTASSSYMCVLPIWSSAVIDNVPLAGTVELRTLMVHIRAHCQTSWFSPLSYCLNVFPVYNP